jgi:hypothetical protein
MQLIKCDRCKDITDYRGFLTVETTRFKNSFDLCQKCEDEMRELIRNAIKVDEG